MPAWTPFPDSDVWVLSGPLKRLTTFYDGSGRKESTTNLEWDTSGSCRILPKMTLNYKGMLSVVSSVHLLHCATFFPSLVISQPNTAFTFLTSSPPISLIRRPISANTSSLWRPPPCAKVEMTASIKYSEVYLYRHSCVKSLNHPQHWQKRSFHYLTWWGE